MEIDPSKFRIGIVVTEGQKPPSPHVIPHVIKVTENRQRYQIAVRGTVGNLLMTLVWVLLGFTARGALLGVLAMMLVDTAIYGLAKWRSERALKRALQEDAPEG